MTRRSERKRPSLVDRLIAQAKVVLIFERIWPPVVVGAGVAALFVALSWLGLWLIVPPVVRIVGVIVFIAAICAVAVFAVRARLPSRADAVARLDRDSGLPHRPISAVEDALANAGTDPATRALWDLHRKRLQGAVTRVRVAPPSPRMVDRDVYSLRAAAVLLLVAAGFVAGPEKLGRLADAFSWQTTGALAQGTRIDAWIDPPGYTGKPPLVLLGQNVAGMPPAGAAVSAPAGSTVVVRTSGDAGVDVTVGGGLKPVDAKHDGAAIKAPVAGTLDKRFTLTGNGHLAIAQDGAPTKGFDLRAIPDLPPRIALVGTPKANLHGSMTLAYTIDDDYGATGAEATFAKPVVNGHPVTGRSLVAPPKGVLGLPPMPGGLGEGKTTLDLSDHPWAGARVVMTLSARDEGGNTGESAPTEITLPAKPFSNPLARALVEQRRDLVLDPDNRDRVETALDALLIAPDAFGTTPGVYLGLHTASTRLMHASSDAQLLDVADLLWAMALRLENGDLTQAQQDLNAAEKDLREAMERGAPPEDISRLTEALRRQMDKVLSEMAQNQQRDQAQDESAPDRNSRTVTQKDLKSMMDRMEEAARNGDMAEAQRLLDQLGNIMENLKSAKRGDGGQNEASREMNKSMNDLSRMMREQGDVRDKTFREGREQDDQDQAAAPDGQNGTEGNQDADNGAPSGSDKQDGAPGRPRKRGGAGQPSHQSLEDRQHALSEQLQGLQKKLRGLGMKGEQGLADAQDAMKDAEGALGKGQGGTGDAVDAQGRALDGLKRGASGLDQQMAQGGQNGQRAEGEGGEDDDQASQQGEDMDPLGRPRQGRSASQTRDLDVSGGLAARAQRVLQELRRRLSDPTRSQEEQDYLERLLKRY